MIWNFWALLMAYTSVQFSFYSLTCDAICIKNSFYTKDFYKKIYSCKFKKSYVIHRKDKISIRIGDKLKLKRRFKFHLL